MKVLSVAEHLLEFREEPRAEESRNRPQIG
jgi:hypothetical protein